MDKSTVKPELNSEKFPEPRTMSDFYKALLLLSFLCLYFCTKLAGAMQLLQGTKPEKSINALLLPGTWRF